MKKCITLTIAILVCAITVNAQEYIYIMKDGSNIGKYKVETEIDSIIFYQPNSDPGAFVTDVDGNIYNVVTIGTQTWMAENLKTTKFNDGTDITPIPNYTQWGNLSTPAYAMYENKPIYGNVYGLLYNWFAASSGKLCPTGWHLPSDVEWTALANFLGGADVAAHKLKDNYLPHWLQPEEATNEVAFNGLPAGYRNTFNGVIDQGVGAASFFWSSTENDDARAMSRVLGKPPGLTSFNHLKTNGYSCRCIKD